MSIVLEKVTKAVNVEGRPLLLFDELDLEIADNARIGILALPKSGKTTLLRMICGAVRPDSGSIRGNLGVSWPIPNGDFLVASASIAWNIRSLARIYGVRDRAFVERIATLSGLSKYLNLPFSKCPPPLRGQLTFALGIGMEFQLYLFDNQVVPARKEFRDEALDSVRRRTEGKAILLATSAPAAIADVCDTIYVLDRGRVTHFPDAKAAVEHFKALQKAQAEGQKLQTDRQKPDDGPDAASEAAAEEEERNAEMVAVALSDL